MGENVWWSDNFVAWASCRKRRPTNFMQINIHERARHSVSYILKICVFSLVNGVGYVSGSVVESIRKELQWVQKL